MDKTQPSQGTLSQGVVLQSRDDQPLLITYDNVLNHAGAVDKDADLAADISGDFNKPGGKFVGTEFVRRDTPPVEALDSFNVALAKTSEITEEFFDRMTPEDLYILAQRDYMPITLYPAST